MRRPPRARGERGASALELAIIAPTLLALIFLTIQTALFLFGRAAAQNAAQQGMSELRLIQPQVYHDSLARKIEQNTESYAARIAGSSLLGPTATSEYDAQTGIASMTVEGQAVSLVPGLTFRTKRTATGPIETFEADK
ncbi:MAG: TadE family protein [Kribbellaceae bacterium]|nr:TadE family protein [Kribbellaceae bacterium]